MFPCLLLSCIERSYVITIYFLNALFKEQEACNFKNLCSLPKYAIRISETFMENLKNLSKFMFKIYIQDPQGRMKEMCEERTKSN